MTEAEVGAAFQARLESMPGLPPVVWPNEERSAIPPDDGDPYFEVYMMRNSPTRMTLDARHERPGIIQVSVVTRAGIGPKTADDLADAVVAHFPCDLRLQDIWIYKRPVAAQGGVVDGTWQVPVSIYYKVL